MRYLFLLLVAALPLSAQSVLVADLWPGAGGGFDLASGNGSFTVYDGKLYVDATDGTRQGIWAYDASTDAFSFVDPDGPNIGSSVDLQGAAVYDGRLFFQANSAVWAYDAAQNDLTLIAGFDFFPPSFFALYDGRLFFTADFGLWAYDAATDAVEPIRHDVDALRFGEPSGLTVFDGSLYFSAATSEEGHELWSYTASTDAAGLVFEARPGPLGGLSRGSSFTQLGSTLYFGALQPEVGSELHALSDGMVSLVADVSPELALHVNAAEPFAVLGGTLYYQGAYQVFDKVDDRENGFELWAFTPGSLPVEVADIFPGPGSSVPFNLTPFGGSLYFAADDGTLGTELWRLRIVNGDAILGVDDINPDNDGEVSSGSSVPGGFTEYAGALFFVAYAPSTGYELRRIGMPTAADPAPEPLASTLRLTGPSPFADRTTFELDAQGALRVAVFDLLGRRVRTLHDGPTNGQTRLELRSEGLAPGLYVVRADGPSVREALRVVVAR